MSKIKITCDICDRSTKFPASETWLHLDNELTICYKCRWPQLGNCLMGIFKFSTQEEAAQKIKIPLRAIYNLNAEQVGRNLQSMAKHIVKFAANLDFPERIQALEEKCLWPKLSARLVELLGLSNMSYLQYHVGLSPSTISELNNQKAGPTMTRMMQILVNLAEKLPSHKRRNFLRSKKFFLD